MIPTSAGLEAGAPSDELTPMSGFLVFLKDMRFTGSWDLPTLDRAIEVGETIAEQSRSALIPPSSEQEPVAWRWRTEIFRDWTVTDERPGDQAEMEAGTGLNMTGLEVQPLYAVPAHEFRIIAAADALREAQKAYIADRGNDAKGRAVADAAASYDVTRAALATVPAPSRVEPVAWQDVIAERRRQVSAEGWTPEHDDEHDKGEMARAAGCYALHGFFSNGKWQTTRYDIEHYLWPWSLDWWKPKDTRRNLVRAAALIVAEIERLDRLENKP